MLHLLILFILPIVAAVFPTIEVEGNKFFYTNNGSQFYVRGIAYQKDTSEAAESVDFIDPLGDAKTCKRDIPYLEQLQTNVIRVYAIDVELNHDECMSMLQDAGIYVIADLSSPKESIITDDPKWDVELLDRYTQVIDEMQKYNNVLGFFAGNEVITDSTNTEAGTFVKAAIRDTKSYMKQKGYRKIPIGYSANDDADTRSLSAEFFTCGDEEQRADFYGINMYEWCGKSSFVTSGYKERTQEFRKLNVPVFFSEYGCNTIQPRMFTDVEALFGKEMTDVWSGGIVYMYFEEENNYGLVTINEEKVSTLADFSYYSEQINKIKPTIARKESMTKKRTLACPTDESWKAVMALPPPPDNAVCECMHDSLECVVKDSVDEEDYEQLFSYVCERVSCDAINANTSDYGGYCFCNPRDKLSFVLNMFYMGNNKKSSACDFSGSATLKKATTKAHCSTLLRSVARQNLEKTTSSNVAGGMVFGGAGLISAFLFTFLF